MPVFGVGHFEKIMDIIKDVKEWNPNFKICGNYLFNASMPEITILSKCIVDEIH